MKRILVCLLALAAVQAAAAAAALAQTPVGPTPNAITIDLNAASQTGRVDFDVPIVLQVPVQSDVTDVDVFKTESRVKPTCNAQMAFPDVPANSWHRFDLGRAADSGVTPVSAPAVAYITLDPVDANRFLCFKFSITRSLSPSELKTFTDQAASDADVRLRGALLRPDGFTGDQVEGLRQALRVSLGITQAGTSGGLHRTVKPGSMLAADATPETKTAFTGFLGGVFAATLNRKSILDDLNAPGGLVDDAGQALAAAANNPLLTRLKGKSPAVDQLLTIVGATPDVTIGHARAIALGLPMDTPDTRPLDQMWDATDVDPRLKSLRGWLATLSTALSFVRGAAAGTVAPAIADTERSALVTLLSAASGALEPVGSDLAGLRDTLEQRSDALATFAANLGARVAADAIVGATSFADFNTRSTWYLSVDAGIGFAPRLKSSFPYAGGNIYFRPVNKEAPLSLRSSFGRRFSLMVGATATDLTEPGKIENSFGTRMLLVGAGYRLTDILRFGAGAVVVNALSPNPLITTDVGVQFTPFFSLSIDWDAKGTFTKVFTETNK